MAPNLALLIGIFLVLLVLLIEYSKKTDVSIALWVPCTWYVLAATRSVGSWLNPSASNLAEIDYAAGSSVDRVVYSIFIAIGIIILIRRKINWFQLLRRNSWIVILFLYMGLSILWSDYTSVSVKRFIKTTGALTMVFVVLTEKDPVESISTLLRRCFLLHFPLSIIMIKYFRTIGVAWDYGGEAEMWVGLTTHKNILGQIAMTGGLYFIWNMLRNWKKERIYIDLVYLFMAFWLLSGSSSSGSKTSGFGLLFGIIILFIIQYIKPNIEHIRKFIIVIVIFLSVNVYFAIQNSLVQFSADSLLSSVVTALGRDITFTGRTVLWKDLLEIASRHPMLGVGYGSFWVGNTHNLWENHIWKPGQGHNGYIDVYVELGLVGIFILIVVIYSAYKKIINIVAYNFEYGRFRLMLLSVILLANITESIFLRGTHNLWFLFLLITVDYSKYLKIDTTKSSMEEA